MRLAGMIVIAVAVVLRWLPVSVRERIEGRGAGTRTDRP